MRQAVTRSASPTWLLMTGTTHHHPGLNGKAGRLNRLRRNHQSSLYFAYLDRGIHSIPGGTDETDGRSDKDTTNPVFARWLELVPVTPEIDLPFVPMVFPISVGVRPGDEALRDELNVALARRWDEIQAILEEYGVPLLPLPKPLVETGGQ